MKNSKPLLLVIVLFSICFLPEIVIAQNHSSLKERGYEVLVINAKYAFFNDLNELTDGGIFENITAGFRKVEGAYEILIDFGWIKEVIYVDFIDFLDVGRVANGLDYQRSVYSDGLEEIILTININHKIAIYSSKKNT